LVYKWRPRKEKRKKKIRYTLREPSHKMQKNRAISFTKLAKSKFKIESQIMSDSSFRSLNSEQDIPIENPIGGHQLAKVAQVHQSKFRGNNSFSFEGKQNNQLAEHFAFTL